MKQHVGISAALVTILSVLFLAPASAQDLQRGARNYQQVIAGKVKLESLPKEQQAEVLLVYRRVQAQRSTSDGSSECRSAASEARAAATELASRARRLRDCAEASDLSDDCDSEFRRTKRAHEDYESAVSQVQSECR